MVLLSKLFEEGIRHRSCANDLIHPDSCTTNAARNLYRFFLSNAKYFAPALFLPLLSKVRRLNNDLLKRSLRSYLETVVVGSTVGWTTQLLICLFRRIFGEFKYHSFLFLPSLIGGCVMYLIKSPHTWRLFETSTIQCALESLLIMRKNVVTELIMDSAIVQTWIFMCCSALILHAKQSGLYQGFWFLTPAPRKSCVEDAAPEQTPQSCHHHKGSCDQFLVQGVRNYLAIGLTLDIAKSLFNQGNGRAHASVAKMVLAKCAQFRMHSSALFASYIGIYRFSYCLFTRKLAFNATLNHLMAGYLAGACYIFYPRVTLLSYGLVLSAQIIWATFCSEEASNSEQPSEFLHLLRKVPFSKVIFPVALGYLVHTYGLRKRHVSRLGETIINGVTDNYAKKIHSRVELAENLLKSK